jgi:hypothetical protein
MMDPQVEKSWNFESEIEMCPPRSETEKILFILK